jgi:hypothetical protein
MRGATPPFSQYVFLAWCLVKPRDILCGGSEELIFHEHFFKTQFVLGEKYLFGHIFIVVKVFLSLCL